MAHTPAFDVNPTRERSRCDLSETACILVYTFVQYEQFAARQSLKQSEEFVLFPSRISGYGRMKKCAIKDTYDNKRVKTCKNKSSEGCMCFSS